MSSLKQVVVPVIDSFRGEHRFLSNFWPCRLVVERKVYASVEHAYQAAKCVDPSEEAMVRAAASPGKAKRLARKVTLRADWESVKVDVMRDLVRRKFFENEELAARLLATGAAELIEGNTWGDTFWGVCRGAGKNWLGRLLMETRDALGASPQSQPAGTGAATDAAGEVAAARADLAV